MNKKAHKENNRYIETKKVSITQTHICVKQKYTDNEAQRRQKNTHTYTDMYKNTDTNSHP